MLSSSSKIVLFILCAIFFAVESAGAAKPVNHYELVRQKKKSERAERQSKSKKAMEERLNEKKKKEEERHIFEKERKEKEMQAISAERARMAEADSAFRTIKAEREKQFQLILKKVALDDHPQEAFIEACKLCDALSSLPEYEMKDWFRGNIYQLPKKEKPKMRKGTTKNKKNRNPKTADPDTELKLSNLSGGSSPTRAGELKRRNAKKHKKRKVEFSFVSKVEDIDAAVKTFMEQNRDNIEGVIKTLLYEAFSETTILPQKDMESIVGLSKDLFEIYLREYVKIQFTEVGSFYLVSSTFYNSAQKKISQTNPSATVFAASIISFARKTFENPEYFEMVKKSVDETALPATLPATSPESYRSTVLDSVDESTNTQKSKTHSDGSRSLHNVQCFLQWFFLILSAMQFAKAFLFWRFSWQLYST